MHPEMMKTTLVRFAALTLTLMLALGAHKPAVAADDYPNRPIRFLQGFAPGGNADVISRVLGEEMSKSMNQPVIAESRAGAGGNLAAEQTARAAPDGYTILLITTAHVISPALYKSLRYDAVKDFEFITNVTDFPFLIVVNAESRFKTIADLVEAARANPGALTVGTAGVGSGQYMCVELFALSIGAKFVQVPYRGDSAAVTGLLGSNVDFIVAPGTAVLGNIEGGRFRALAISGSQRWAPLKDVPTVAETVAPGFEMMAWAGVATTHGVPRPIVDRLNTELRRAMALPHVEQRLRDLGGIPSASTPEEMTAKVASHVKRWIDVGEKAGLARQ
jgi:tripartite-type tricarboxylate transporter receptor subunit TctC